MEKIWAKGLTRKEYLAKYKRENPDKYRNYIIAYRPKVYKWRKDNPEKYKAIEKRYYYKNRIKRILNSRRWYTKNKLAVIARNRIWRNKNKDKVKVYRHNREKLEVSGVKTGTITEFTIKELIKSQSDICALCKDKMMGNYTLDHIIPISKNGHHEIYNIQLVHHSCNSMKNNKVLEKDILKTICQYLSYKNVFWYRQNSGVIFSEYKGKKRAFRMGAVGAPDIVAIIRGQYIGIEVKNETNSQSEGQKQFQQKSEKAGACYLLVRSVEDLIGGLSKLEAERYD